MLIDSRACDHTGDRASLIGADLDPRRQCRTGTAVQSWTNRKHDPDKTQFSERRDQTVGMNSGTCPHSIGMYRVSYLSHRENHAASLPACHLATLPAYHAHPETRRRDGLLQYDSPCLACPRHAGHAGSLPYCRSETVAAVSQRPCRDSLSSAKRFVRLLVRLTTGNS